MQPQDHYAALIQSSDDAIIAKDLDGNVISWNPAAERLFGWSSKEMIGQSVRRLLPADRQDEEDRILARIRAGEAIGFSIAERVHKDGRRIAVAVTISPLRDAGGRIVGASKIARDATERMIVENRLLESEQRFRMLADNIAQLVWTADGNGAITWFNQRWYDYTGFDPAQVGGKALSQILPEEMREEVRERYRAQMNSGEEWDDLFPLRGADGKFRWFLSHAKPIRDENNAIVAWFGSNTDITEQREQSEQINVLLREVNHRSKNMLAKVQALARSSIDGGDHLVKRFEERVGSLSVNQDILVRRDWKEVPVEELVRLQLRFLEGAGGRIESGGPDCALVPRAAEIIGMALHELATNSLKYGALSDREGRVEVRWDHSGGRFHMVWRESGGPAVAPPTRRGFGSQLIEDIPRRALDAEVVHDFPPDGMIWSFTASDDLLAGPMRSPA